MLSCMSSARVPRRAAHPGCAALPPTHAAMSECTTLHVGTRVQSTNINKALLRRRVITLVASSSRDGSIDASREVRSGQQSANVVVTCAAGIMLACAVLRVNFAAVAPSIADELGLSMIQLAYMHSSFLIGYFLGHLPAGLLADRIGGYTVLCSGAMAWSVVTLLHAPLTMAPAAIAPMALATLRLLVGLTTAVAVPGLAATLAQALPEDQRSKAMSTCYGMFNLGSVLGLAFTPAIASLMSWPAAFALLGGMSTIVAVQAYVRLQKTMNPSVARASTVSEASKEFAVNDRTDDTKPQSGVYKLSPQQGTQCAAVQVKNPMQSLGEPTGITHNSAVVRRGVAGMTWPEIRDYAALIYHHSAIGWGFFLFQNWLPTYLQSLHISDAILRGFLSALPWLPCVGLALAFGAIFENLRKGGMSAFRSQTIAHSIASIGAAVALMPVACLDNVSPVAGLACIGAALSLQTCNYSGFHAYVQTKYPDRAGRLLAVTNCCGIIAGLIANLAMGWMVDATGSYSAMFAATAGIYFFSWVVWLVCLREQPRVLSAVTV
eukprot:jgi/Ulvmu1/5568/UM023_0105.1